MELTEKQKARFKALRAQMDAARYPDFEFNSAPLKVTVPEPKPSK